MSSRMAARVSSNAGLLLGVLAVALMLGCGNPATDPRAEQQTKPEPGTLEREGQNAPGDVGAIEAERWIDDVRVGAIVGADGVVTVDVDNADFGANDAINMSMRVSDAPAGSAVRVAVFDSMNRQVWDEQKSVPAGAHHIVFAIGDDLDPGNYEAHVIVGDERVAVEHFEVMGG